MIHTTQECRIGDNTELMREMPADSIDTIITSPPYWGLRDYGVDGQIGLEPTMEEYHARMLEVTAECMRVLKPAGVMFWNHGDSYNDKSSDMQNERLIIKMIDDQGWILRNRIIWNKPNGMPSPFTDRFSNKYEPVYMLVKSKKYWFDLDAVRKPCTEPMNRWGGQKLKANGKSECDKGTGQESYRDRDMRPDPLGKNPGDVCEMTQVEWMNYCHDLWDMFVEEQGDIMKIPTQPYKESHFATFPTKLIEPMIKAACPAEICPACGLERERIVDKEIISPRTINGVPDSTSRYSDGEPETGTRFGDVQRHTAGWTSCDCNAGWIAGTVLDPFAGSGTVGEVARNLNRNAILLELNPAYGELIAKRTMANNPPLTAYFGGECP